mmetsp:Transcript_36092/g.85616  ORF Transcript_36092/g.85616 Transcript_36092/m.85616 type:complete len:133 (-) Transcript_36092:356-754(-)
MQAILKAPSLPKEAPIHTISFNSCSSVRRRIVVVPESLSCRPRGDRWRFYAQPEREGGGPAADPQRGRRPRGDGFDSDYYLGMLRSPLSESDRERQISQDRDGLRQNLKLAAGMSLLIGALLLGFMASNGLL